MQRQARHDRTLRNASAERGRGAQHGTRIATHTLQKLRRVLDRLELVQTINTHQLRGLEVVPEKTGDRLGPEEGVEEEFPREIVLLVSLCSFRELLDGGDELGGNMGRDVHVGEIGLGIFSWNNVLLGFVEIPGHNVDVVINSSIHILVLV